MLSAVRPVTVTDTTFASEVVESELPVLVFMWADWNSTCKALAPTITALAEDYAERVKVAKLDVDANPRTPALFAVVNVPTLLILDRGQVVSRIVGYRHAPVIRAELDEVLTSATA